MVHRVGLYSEIQKVLNEFEKLWNLEEASSTGALIMS